ncbi:MAG: fused MFS/spermidine synthase, partial [bacterium]|nr:fused MFS/spermidine synthase [bacterium]
MNYFITAFLSGAAVMVAEISAARAIAPHFGASVVVWTNVIGIILIALSSGYWVGGRIVDRHADMRLLGAIIAAAGVLLILPAFATPFIAGSLIGELLRAGSGFLVLLIGSFVSVVLLFALPIFLLGMVSPFLVKLAADGRTDIGAVAGRLYAISTVGSLVGTFLPTLLLLPILGTRATILSAAAVLVVLGAVLMRRRAVVMLAVVPLALLTLRALPPPWFLGGRVVAAAESRYQYLRIIDHGDERLLAFNEGFGVQSVAVTDDHVPEGYFSAIAALPGVFADDSRRIRVLILGNAGGTIGNLMQRFFPDRSLDITGVELDPAVTALTSRWFPPPPRPYPIIHADSRTFVRGSDEQYDIIVVDA